MADSWVEREWRSIKEWIVILFWCAVGWGVFSGVEDHFFPDHPAPVQIEADGKTYTACNTPDVGRSKYQQTYYVDFKDNNGSMVSLRGVERLVETNLPSKVDAPMPRFLYPHSPIPDADAKDKDGKPYKNGYVYTWPDSTALLLKDGVWAPLDFPPATSAMEGEVREWKDGEFGVLYGGKAQVRKGKWVPVKVKNDVCKPDDK
jgi:hypothetical protein